jgi:predicted phosphoribosyltransferase
MSAPFPDRRAGGRALADRLAGMRGTDPVVVGLPRGGVPVAREVADALGAPLDVILVRKLGVPFQPELAMGAIGEDGVRVIDEELIAIAAVGDDALARVEARERAELDRRAEVYRRYHPRLPLADRTVIVVDDGLATGSTARAAVEVARAQGAARVVLAVPVAPAETAAALTRVADEVVVVDTPEPFYAVGNWYRDFGQLTDDDVAEHLHAAPSAGDPAPSAGDPGRSSGGIRRSRGPRATRARRSRAG